MASKEKISSRQRVLKTLNQKIPDRVPIDFDGFHAGIHIKAYNKLLNHLGITHILDHVVGTHHQDEV